MMRADKNRVRRFVAQLALLLLLLVAGSCSPTQKALKSGDSELIYNYAMEMYNSEEWGRAKTLYEAAEPYYVGTAREDSLEFYKARCAYKSADFESAVSELDEFRRTYGRSPFLEDAEGMYAMSYYYLAPGADRDQGMTQIAIRAIDEFVSRYPVSQQCKTFLEIKQELMSRLHQKSFNNAYTYFKIGRYKSSIVAFRNAMKEYPDSFLREDISFYIVASAYELAHNSVESKREDRYLSMIDAYYTFIAEFPDSESRAKTDKMLSEAREYIAKKRANEGKKKSQERVLFWKKIFKPKSDEQQVDKVAIEDFEVKRAEKREAKSERQEAKQESKNK